MKRREFLALCGLAAASCLIPSAMARAIRDTCVLARRPHLVLPRNPKSTLYAIGSSGTRDFMLHFGDPREETEIPTWRDYFDEYEHRSAGALGVDGRRPPAGRHERERGSQRIDVDNKQQVGDPEDDPVTIVAGEKIDGAALEKWEFRQEVYEGPAASAYRYLEDLPLDDGRGISSKNPLGDLRFIEGDRPGSNLTYVEAPDLATLACLQHRLNELDENLAIEIGEW